jgi:hypothetical protein
MVGCLNWYGSSYAFSTAVCLESSHAFSTTVRRGSCIYKIDVSSAMLFLALAMLEIAQFKPHYNRIKEL